MAGRTDRNHVGEVMEFSPSAINMFLTCPHKYGLRYGYITGTPIKTPPSGGITVGTAVHEGIHVNYTEKMSSGKDAALSVVQDATAAKFDGEAEQTVFEEFEDKNDLQKEAVKLATMYRIKHAPEIYPKAVEQKYTSTFQSPFDGSDITLIGFLDLYDQNSKIHDTKTTLRKGKMNDRYMRQVRTYQTLLEANGEPVSELVVDFVEKGNREVSQLPVPKLSEAGKEALQHTVAEIDRAVKNKVFVPNTGHYLCHKIYCPFWGKQCQYGPLGH